MNRMSSSRSSGDMGNPETCGLLRRLVQCSTNLLWPQDWHSSLYRMLKASTNCGPHRAPFDHLLAAQAQIEDLPVISNDSSAGSGAELRPTAIHTFLMAIGHG